MSNRTSLLIILYFPLALMAQTERRALSLQEATALMETNNRTLQMADKAIEMVRGERQKLNAFWFPAINASGMYAHLSNQVEVRQPLDKRVRGIRNGKCKRRGSPADT